MLPVQTNGWTVKDVLAHLHAWQQVSNARVTAALEGGEPRMPDWLKGGDPESESELDAYNERIYQMYRQQTWDEVQKAWRAGFTHLIENAGRIAQTDLLNEKKYAWLKGFALIAVLRGTLEHHAEHFIESKQGLLQ